MRTSQMVSWHLKAQVIFWLATACCWALCQAVWYSSKWYLGACEWLMEERIAFVIVIIAGLIRCRIMLAILVCIGILAYILDGISDAIANDLIRDVLWTSPGCWISYMAVTVFCYLMLEDIISDGEKVTVEQESAKAYSDDDGDIIDADFEILDK